MTSKSFPVNWHDAGVVETGESPYAKLSPVPIHAVKMLPGFWKPRMDANREASIPALLKSLEEHGVVDNFRRVCGRKCVERKGPYFTDSDLYKWMEAAALTLQSDDDPKIRRLFDDVIDDVLAAQRDSGYLNTFFVDEIADRRFKNLAHEHELYCAGHFIQAAIAHYRATGSTKLLDAAKRFADYLCTVFGPGKIEIPDGHPEIELALVELYRTTGEQSYLDLAGFFLKIQEFQAMTEVHGHAVRAGYLASGAADYYMETGEEEFKYALDRLWSDMVNGKMYITGGIGSTRAGEAFGRRYELPNESAYAETCAAISSIFWNWRMLAFTGDAVYTDLLERTLYNGFLAGVSLDGCHYFYVNPLACYHDYERAAWHGCTCCPPNVERMIASMPGCMYSTSDSGIWVHLYDNSRLDWRLEDGRKVALEQKTHYPWNGTVEITVQPEEESEFSIFLRVPAWCGGGTISISGEAEHGVVPGEYIELARTWKPGDVVRLELPMEICLQESDPRVRENLGSVAIQRGPIIYCLESSDNDDVPIRDVHLRTGEELTVDHRPHLLGGVSVIGAKGFYDVLDQDRGSLYHTAGKVKLRVEETDLKAIPYYAWANRGRSHMTVWIPKT